MLLATSAPCAVVASQDEYAGAPRWVKVMGIVAAIVLLLAVGVLVLGGSEHGPGRHAPGGSPTPTGNDSTTPHATAGRVAAGAHAVAGMRGTLLVEPRHA